MNPTREMRVLRFMQEKRDAKLSEVAYGVNLTVQETTRMLRRLNRFGVREVYGSWTVTEST